MSCCSRMSRLMLVCLYLCLGAGCGKFPSPFSVKDRSPRSHPDTPFDPPNTYPEWAYDAPQYVRPPHELKPEPKVNSSDPLHYFTNQKVVMVRRPEGFQPEDIPRVAVWWTDNNGFHWNKAGYFGRQQTFFAFEVEEDGDYGIRFVGPGQDPALHSLPYPERVYHVDTVLPDVDVHVEPEKTWYHVGETVTISWRAADYHLVEFPVRIGLLYDFTAQNDPSVEIQRDLPDEGVISFTLPPEALDHEVRFRVDAIDRAGNLGIAISFALQVVPEESKDVDELVLDSVKDSSASDNLASTADDELMPVRPAARSPASGAKTDTTSALLNDDDFLYAENLDPVSPGSLKNQSALPMATVAARAADPERGFQWDAASTGATLGTSPWSRPENDIDASPGNPVGRTPLPANFGSGNASGLSAEDLTAVDGLRPYEPTSPSVRDILPASSDFISMGETRSAQAENALLAAWGITHSDNLLVPMPATVQATPTVKEMLIAHPWRTLHGVIPLAMDTIWSLPRPRFASDELNRILSGSYLADGRFPYPVTEPSAIGGTVVSVPEESLGNQMPSRP